MGIVFGVTGTKEPPFSLLVSSPYQIRAYEPFLIAEVPSDDDGSSFGILAKYIGVFGDPSNESRRSMDMTSPVIMEPAKLAMTSPVINTKNYMSFVMPFEYTSIEQLPKPLDRRIKLKAVPRKYIAVRAFSGWYSAGAGYQQLDALMSMLKRDKLIAHDQSRESIEWSVAQYHPPFTIPFLRRNEIWVSLDPEKSEEFKRIVEKVPSLHKS